MYAQQDAGVDFGPIAKVDFKKHLLEVRPGRTLTTLVVSHFGTFRSLTPLLSQGEWKGKGAAGSGPTWSNNPQYTICFADPVEKATLTLSTGTDATATLTSQRVGCSTL